MAYKKTVCLMALILIFLNSASLDAARKGHKSFAKRLCAFFMGAALVASADGLVKCDFEQRHNIWDVAHCANVKPDDINVALKVHGELSLNGYRSRGFTPLEEAVLSKNVVVIKALLQKGAKTGAAFHDAISYHSDSTEFIKILVDNGADINSNEDRFNQKNTPLHWAALQGNYEAVSLLISLGADPLKENARGWLPSDIARVNMISCEGPCDELVSLWRRLVVAKERVEKERKKREEF